ncbi:UDP-N-acetyl glucosamine 2-epimerase [Mycetocola sp. JXN-3]|uniref:UDP-N-acetyl glucosamine 2-epimerase n=1 Tax=Mycetocola sp. JXN-3 TaxID=2116510 RepID=UPI00165D2DE8|nr:UDP-N-acetylglucosamine 2-epimerase [Mycetocola sp. JXN-3]
MSGRQGDAPIAVVLGTRAETIRLAPLIRRLHGRARVFHTGSLGESGVSARFFAGLGLGTPDVVLNGTRGPGEATPIGAGLIDLAAHFAESPPAAVMVFGNAPSASMGAQAARYAGLPVVQVGAGMAAQDRDHPEETTRQVVTALTDLHCVATPENAENLRIAGVEPDRIRLTGSTGVEAAQLALSTMVRARPVPDAPSGYVIATIAHPENIETRAALERILRILGRGPLPTVLALHPRTAEAVTRFGLDELLTPLQVRRNLGYRAFLELAARARLLVTDSDGVQEEATVLGKPVLVLRRSTRYPEAITSGFAVLVTPGMDLRLELAVALADVDGAARLAGQPSPFGDGRASERILRHTAALIEDHRRRLRGERRTPR